MKYLYKYKVHNIRNRIYIIWNENYWKYFKLYDYKNKTCRNIQIQNMLNIIQKYYSCMNLHGFHVIRFENWYI